ncbi:hypothetical protein ACROYT_G009032 [Oculina patagonica]
MTGFLICSFLLLSLLSSGSSLKCQTCYSQKSWADCSRNSKVLNCEPFLDTCMTVHRKKTLHDGTITHEFAKSCFMSTLCSRSFCEQNMSSQTKQVTCGVLKCSRNPAAYAVKPNSLKQKLRKLTDGSRGKSE